MTQHPFSPAGRSAALRSMTAGPLDLLVIGGGITGCGLARDAALQGLSVALVERDDFACGTSSRSSKLVHGGLRYLAIGDVRMVRESARERRVLQAIAPHLVHPLPFLMPVWKGTSMAKYRVALWLYDQLATPDEHERHRRLTPAEIAARLPVQASALRGGLIYGEYSTDDARFTLENAMSAAQYGALVANHAAAVRLLRVSSGRVEGAVVQDTITGETFTVHARVVVNATGPWAARTLEQGGIVPPRQLIPSKGIHILIPARRLPMEGAVALNAPSGLSGFAVRRGEYVYVGTTDAAYSGPLERVMADSDAVARVLALVQDCFPSLELTMADVTGTWAGLRPLIAHPGRAPRDTSRHDEVWRTCPGLITIAGGKLTTYRTMARRVMKHVARELGQSLAPSERTATVPLPGAGTAVDAATEKRRALEDLRARGVSRPTLDRLDQLYGLQLQHLLALGEADASWLLPLAEDVPALRGEAKLAVEEEMALTLPDLLDRRLALLLFGPDHGLAAAAEGAAIMASILGWDPIETERQVAAYHDLVEVHTIAAPH